MTTPNEQTIAHMARKEQALQVGRPPNDRPGWTVWHLPSGLQAIKAVQYKADAEAARTELLMLAKVDWTMQRPARLGSREWDACMEIFRKYEALRLGQLGNHAWSRPGHTSRSHHGHG
jgi:hypothetical protein